MNVWIYRFFFPYPTLCLGIATTAGRQVRQVAAPDRRIIPRRPIGRR